MLSAIERLFRRLVFVSKEILVSVGQGRDDDEMEPLVWEGGGGCRPLSILPLRAVS